MKHQTKNRILSFFLALVMLCTSAPFPAISLEPEESAGNLEQVEDTTTSVYEKYVGYLAEINFEYYSYLVISDDPTIDMQDGQELVEEDVSGTLVLEIIDYYWDEESYALWYKVAAAPGYVLPDKLQENPWAFQNYTDVYEDEDWESFSPDSLIIYKPKDSQPANIVSDEGITVSSDSARFTDLIVTETEAPTAYYINRAVSYNMTPRTNEGLYTEHAVVTIPIPEGWDTSKLFGYVMEEDGTITALLGTVTKFGTFQFTVPHFSEVGLLEATSVSTVLNKTIVFGKIQSGDPAYVFSLEGKQGEPGRYVTDDGAVQYVVNHITSTDATTGETTTTTYVSLVGLDVTTGTEIVLGSYDIVVIVEALKNEATKLLTAGAGANSATLNPLYDVGISGDFIIEYTLVNGGDYITLTDNVITAKADADGEATVKAEIKHPTSKKVVGYVTYRVVVSSVNVTSVRNIHVPARGSATISGLSGTIDTSVLDPNIASISADNGDVLSNETLTINSQADEGITYVAIGEVLYIINTNPNNQKNDTKKYISIDVAKIENCTMYYAINGGPLYPVTGSNIFFEQDYEDGVSIMFFSAPNAGYVTSKMEATGSDGQYYSLSNGDRYDGSDSNAWPFVDSNANSIPSTSDDSAWVSGHGFRWALLEGNINIAQLRDVFTRALALGCDSVTTFTKNSTVGLDTTLTFIAEALPSFHKTIKSIKRKNGTVEDYTTTPYDPDINTPLEIGDTVTYQFTITVSSSNITYWFDVEDSSIGYEASSYKGEKTDANGITVSKTFEKEYVIGMTDGSVDETKIKLYANGEFTNTAVLTYSYKSAAAKGKTETVANSSVTCRVSSIVTWMDNFGTVWRVENIANGSTLTQFDAPTKIGYTFQGWDYNTAITNGYIKSNSDSTYTVTYGAASSFTIHGNFTANNYKVTYKLDDDTVLEEVEYTIEDTVTLKTPTREGYTFIDWSITDRDGNWPSSATLPGGMVLLNRYGNITLTAQWDPNEYTITFDTDGGSEIAPITQDCGTAVTAPADPSKTGYAFVGWDREIPATMPAGDITITAQWKVNEYTITFDTGGGTAIDPITQDYNTAVTAPADPTKTGYTFAGWDKTIPSTMPAENITIKAQWTVNKYTITWIVDDGAQTKEIYEYGATVNLPADPTRTGYTFVGWVGNVPDTMPAYDLTFTAEWTPNTDTKYVVKHYQQNLDDNEFVLVLMENLTGTTDTLVTPAVNSYDGFIAPAVQTVKINADGTTVVEYYYTRKLYTVTWKNADGTILETDLNVKHGAIPVYDGETPIKVGDAQYSFTFKGWTPAVSSMTEDVTYTAEYTQMVNKYTVTWVDGDGNVLYTEPLAYGDTPAYTGEMPTKTPTAQYTYTFSGWDKEVVAVTGDATYTATFTETVRTYTITWLDEDDTVLKVDQEVAYGETPKCNSPTKAPDADDPWHVWEFSGWTPEVVSVTGDATYKATYEKVKSKVYIGVNLAYYQTNSTYNYDIAKNNNVKKSSYHTLPDEPHKLHDIELWRAHISDGKWVIDKNWGQAYGDAENYIDKSILNDTEHYQSNYCASGVTDPEGTLVKQYFKFSSEKAQDDAVYDTILAAWLSTSFTGGNMEIKWEKVLPKDCTLIPYVVKLQDNGHWYVDMIVIVETTPLTIHVPDIPDSGEDQMFLFKITSPNHEGFELIVAVPEGGSVTINELYNAKTYVVTELTGWSWRSGDSPGWVFVKDADAQGDTGCMGTGVAAEIVLSATGNVLTFTNTFDDPDWLGDEDYEDNDFGEFQSTT